MNKDNAMKIQDPVERFFYKLLTGKKPGKNASGGEFYIWALKYLTGVAYFELSSKYYDFWEWSTRYYPFSKFYTDRLFHHNNRGINKFMLRLERILKKEKINTYIMRGAPGDLFIELYGTFVNDKDNSDKSVKKIESILQKKFDTIYARKIETGFMVLIPTEVLADMGVIY